MNRPNDTFDDDVRTDLLGGDGPQREDALFLLVITRGKLSPHPLPAEGTITIGRSSQSDVQIVDSTISREHAVLEIGPPLRLRHLRSANGARVRRRPLAAHEVVQIELGEVFDLGGVMLVVQQGAPMLSTAAASSDPSADPPSLPVLADGTGATVHDPAMMHLHEMLGRVAGSMLSVLLLGETGVGKEVFANAVHYRSARAAGPFVAINCAEIAPTLLESELFGHEKGAFTGAATAKQGLFEAADGGTLFLDEIAEMPVELQVKLLRVLEERRIRRVGALRSRPINARIVSATHRDLREHIAKGKFRLDLFHRISGVTFSIPPLRERVSEIVPLAKRFAASAALAAGYPACPPFSRDACTVLERCSWPGNVRELRNTVERAVYLCGGATIEPTDLSSDLAPSRPAPSGGEATHTTPRKRDAHPEPQAAPRRSRSKANPAERSRIIEALEQCAGNQTRAAQMLGIPRRTLVLRLAEYGLPRPRKS